MAIPSSGSLALENDISWEFGGGRPHSISEFYRGGLYVPDTASTSNIPTSGSISFSDFYGQEAITYAYPYVRYGGFIDGNTNDPFYSWIRMGSAIYEQGSGYPSTPYSPPSGIGCMAYLAGEFETNMVFFTGHHADELNNLWGGVEVTPYIGTVYSGWTNETIGGLNMTLLRGQSFGTNWYNTVNNGNAAHATFYTDP